MQQLKLHKITLNFLVKGDFIEAVPLGNGHINDTYLVTTSSEKYVLQRLNQNIFKNIEMMNQNIIMALNHLHQKQNITGNKMFTEFNIIFCEDGNNYHKDNNGNFWRMMNFVSNSTSFNVADKPEIAFEAAKAYGYFQKMLVDLHPKDFFTVIKDFHNLEMRMNSFLNVIKTNVANRNQFALDEIKFVNEHNHLSVKLKDLLDSNQIPIRVTHNDTKINNVLLNKNSLRGIAVIDLDTIMPGIVLFDFGDMVRTFTSPAQEDETDLSKVVLRLDIFRAMANGYLLELKNVLNKTEINHLVFGGKIMTFMIGLRFLTDFLEGDSYFKISQPHHNLHRCRTQFKLLREIEENEDKMKHIIEEIVKTN